MKKESVTTAYRLEEQINTIPFTYDALGNKLQKQVTPYGSSTTTTTDYANGLLYKNGQLQFASHPEGYLQPKTNGSLEYVYQYTDHLGNIRLSYKKGSSDELIVVEENNYYPFGMRHEGYNNLVDGQEFPFRYNGKEFNEELGLGWYDYGARFYDPALGRWMIPDAFSELYTNKTPYHYVDNNPINKVDIGGHFEINFKNENRYKTLTNYLKNGIGEILRNPVIMNGLQKYGGFSEKEVKDKIVKFGKGSIKLEIVDNLPFGANGYYMGGRNRPIQISSDLAMQIENATSDEERELAILSFLITALHESVHYGDWTYRGSPTPDTFEFIDAWGYPIMEREIGRAFEIDVFWDGDITNYDGAKKGKEGMNAMKNLSKKKISNDKIKDLTEGLQNFIRRVQKENPEIEIFILD